MYDLSGTGVDAVTNVCCVIRIGIVSSQGQLKSGFCQRLVGPGGETYTRLFFLSFFCCVDETSEQKNSGQDDSRIQLGKTCNN